MTITLGFLALLMGTVLWWLFRQSVGVQPWVAQTSAHEMQGPVVQPAAKTALWVFLAVATSLFALFISAYAMRIDFLDWTPLPQPRLLTLNTVLLVLASGAMEWAVFGARRGNLDRLRQGLTAGGMFALAFIAGQLIVWRQLVEAGYLINTNAATGFFYLLTAVHALHVLGGLVAWVRTSTRAWRSTTVGPVRLGVELCAIYWHFLLVAWVVLFTVLVSSYLGLSICAPSVPL